MEMVETSGLRHATRDSTNNYVKADVCAYCLIIVGKWQMLSERLSTNSEHVLSDHQTSHPSTKLMSQ